MAADCIAKVLRVPGCSLEIECRVYDTRRRMLLAIRKDDIGGIANDTLAYCATQRARMMEGRAAIVYLCRPYLDHDTIAHEFVHAGLAIMARRKTRSIPCTTEDAPEVEEEFADLVGTFVGEFYKKFGIK